MSLADLQPRAPRSVDQAGPEQAVASHRTARIIVAALLDIVVVTLPAWVGALIVMALSDSNGGGSADRLVFGSVGVLGSIAALIADIGFAEGHTGAGIGKRCVGLIARTRQGKPLGVRASLNPLAARQIVPRDAAYAEGFTPYVPEHPARAQRRRRRGWFVALLLILLVVALASLAVGSRALSVADIGSGLLPPYGQNVGDAAVIVRELRLPRTILALVVGIALGVAGAVMQGQTRNPLADPGILGISAGAACAVVVAIYLLGVVTPLGYVWFAFGGALIASVIVFGISALGRGLRTPLTLVLGGAALAAFLGSITSALVLLDESTLDSYRFLIVGSVANRGLDVLYPLMPFLLAGLLLALVNAPGLNLLASGDDVATGLGLNVTAHRVAGIAAITLLTGVATAACGPIGFVGLVAPHLARAITGPDYRWTVPFSGLFGAVMLSVADVVGRVVLRPGELQVGIVVALIGGPVFIAIIRRRRLASL